MNIGDMVEIRIDIREGDGIDRANICREMLHYAGMITTIDRVIDGEAEIYKLTDCGNYWWHGSVLKNVLKNRPKHFKPKLGLHKRRHSSMSERNFVNSVLELADEAPKGMEPIKDPGIAEPIIDFDEIEERRVLHNAKKHLDEF